MTPLSASMSDWVTVASATITLSPVASIGMSEPPELDDPGLVRVQNANASCRLRQSEFA